MRIFLCILFLFSLVFSYDKTDAYITAKKMFMETVRDQKELDEYNLTSPLFKEYKANLCNGEYLSCLAIVFFSTAKPAIKGALDGYAIFFEIRGNDLIKRGTASGMDLRLVISQQEEGFCE